MKSCQGVCGSVIGTMRRMSKSLTCCKLHTSSILVTAVRTTWKSPIVSKITTPDKLLAAHIKYLHLNLEDTNNQKVDSVFQEIFQFIYSATLPKLKRDESGTPICSPTLLETLTPTTKLEPSKDAPISN